MDLDLTPEQELLAETVRGVCARHCDPGVVRTLEDDPVGFAPEFWKQLGELGLLGMTIPEADGGTGMTMLDAVVAYVELGRALAPSPHFASSVVAATVIGKAGSDAQRTRWLQSIAAGTDIIIPAWLEPESGYGPGGVQARMHNGRITGTKRHVLYASSATRLLVLARDGGEIALALVDPNAAGVTLTQQMSVASDTQYRVDLDNAPVDDVITGGWNVWNAVMHEAIILAAAYAVGGARQALDITVQYSKDRQQFDKPLGAFQALAHYLADAATAVDGAQTLVWEAGWARANGRSIDRLAPMAKLFACRTFRDVTAMGQQIFGGVGFTVDYDIQLYFRRAKLQELSWWDTRYLEQLVAADVLDRVGA